MKRTTTISLLAAALALIMGCASSGKAEKPHQAQEQIPSQPPIELPLHGRRVLGELKGQIDWYSVQVTEDGRLTVGTVGGTNTYLEAFDESRTRIAYADDGGQGMNAALAIEAKAGQTYLFKVSGAVTVSSTNTINNRGQTVSQESRTSARGVYGITAVILGAEQRPEVLTNNGEWVVINGVAVSYSDGIINTVNSSYKVASVKYSYGSTTTTGGQRITSIRISTITIQVGTTRQDQVSRENPPEEITILEVTLS